MLTGCKPEPQVVLQMMTESFTKRGGSVCVVSPNLQRTTLSRSTVLFGEMFLKPLPKMLTSSPPLAPPLLGSTFNSNGWLYWTNSALYGLKVPGAPPLSETVTTALRGAATLGMTQAMRSWSSSVPSTSSPFTLHTSCPPPKS